MILNTETVVFTPYQPLGFRIAVFGFADFGSSAIRPNIFKNNFFTSFGFGVRLRNERLVFNTVQIRLGIAFGKHGLVDCEYFRLSNPTSLEQYRYRPTRPRDRRFRITRNPERPDRAGFKSGTRQTQQTGGGQARLKTKREAERYEPFRLSGLFIA